MCKVRAGAGWERPAVHVFLALHALAEVREAGKREAAFGGPRVVSVGLLLVEAADAVWRVVAGHEYVEKATFLAVREDGEAWEDGGEMNGRDDGGEMSEAR